MWTFLGIVSFTYLYKKLDTFLTSAPRELVVAAVLCLAAGLLLSYIRYFHEFRLLQVLQVPLSLLASLPLFKHVLPRMLGRGKENKCKKVRGNLFISGFFGQSSDKITACIGLFVRPLFISPSS